MRANDERGAAVEQFSKRRDRRLDAHVVDDRAALEGDVEVAADQYSASPEVAEVLERSQTPGAQRLVRLELRADELDEIHQPVRVPPLVVVPTEDLHLVTERHGRLTVDDHRVRIPDDVR